MSKYYYLILLFSLFGKAVLAQQEPLVTGSYKAQKTIDIIDKIEAQTGYYTYYDPSWLDSLTTSVEWNQTPLNTALSQLFEGTEIHFFLSNKNIYLTHSTEIISSPEIVRAIGRQQQSTTTVSKGLVFEREYLGVTVDQSDLENYVFEIGNRKLLQPGESATIAGYITDRDTGEPIIGAVVYSESPMVATTTDFNGFYSLNLPSGKNTILVQYAGMKSSKRKVVLFSSGKLDVEMAAEVIALKEVTIESDRDVNVKGVQMGVSKIDVQETKNVPIVLGEKDILKVATTYAGVQTVGEGGSGYNVRGGKSDQNLILFNGAPVFNASHFFGFFSVFNSDALQNMEIYKSGIPANYGGRLSSVFDITALKANQEKFVGVGGISPITSKLTLEIPIIKNKAGLMLGGRTTYSNWVLKQTQSASFKDNRVSFADLILRYDHEINEKNDITISGYLSTDEFRMSSDTLFSYSSFSFANANASAKWSHIFNDHFTGDLTATYARYKYELNYTESAPNAFRQDFDIQESAIQADLKYYIGERHSIFFGAYSKLHQINPGGKYAEGEESIVAEVKIADESAIENGVYISEQYELTPDISLYGGLRYSFFSALGPQTSYIYAEDVPKNEDNIIGTENYDKGEIIKTYHGPEFRLSARYSIDKNTSIKGSYNRTRQYIHTLSNSASLSPTDTWRLSSKYIAPQIADQYAVGFYKNLRGGSIEASAEAYYKKLQNLLDFKVGADFLLNDKIETIALQGPGKSYGVEFSVKKEGRLSGWVNYSYARTFVKLDGEFPEEIINNGLYYPTNYDKPHTVNLVMNWKLTHRISFSYNFTYNTGRPVTYPSGQYAFKDTRIIAYSQRNAYRIPDYLRMDLGISLEAGHKIQKLAHSYWTLSIYNLTGRDNPFSVFFDVQGNEVRGYKLVVFGDPIPTITYNFRF